MPTSTLTSKGQITIPKEVRDSLGVETGDRLTFVVQADGSVLMTAITHHVRDLGGLLHRPGRRAASPAEIDEGIRRRMRTRFGRRR